MPADRRSPVAKAPCQVGLRDAVNVGGENLWRRTALRPMIHMAGRDPRRGSGAACQKRERPGQSVAVAALGVRLDGSAVHDRRQRLDVFEHQVDGPARLLNHTCLPRGRLGVRIVVGDDPKRF
jgi:hypothetical protein